MHYATGTRQHGFNLIEIVTVLSIALIALGTLVPLAGSAVAALHQRTAMNDWMSALAHARLNAIEHRHTVVACPSSGEICEPSTLWQNGWIVFEDIDRDAQRDPGEPILLVNAAQPALRIMTNAGRKQIRYRFDGSSDGSNATITFCDRRGPEKARTLIVNNAGRVRSDAATAAQAAAACG
jgi:type IV fimbrial biogenesis protein FimT